jgi:hypothetical protein
MAALSACQREARMEDLSLEIDDELMDQLQREAAAVDLSLEDYAREKLIRSARKNSQLEQSDRPE